MLPFCAILWPQKGAVPTVATQNDSGDPKEATTINKKEGKLMKKKTIRILSLLLSAALAFSLAGCGGSDSTAPSASSAAASVTASDGEDATPAEATSHQGGKVTHGLNGNPTEFFTPYKQGTLNNYGWSIFEPLAWDHVDGSFEPCLAESWEVDEASNTMTIKLREGVTFSNGYPFTADDVVFTLTCREEYGTYGLIGSPVSVEKVDDYTVKVTWADFSLNFAAWILPQYMYSHKLFEEKGLDWMLSNMVGTGPYVMDEYIPDVHLTVTRNEDYWGEKAPGPDAFEWVCITDQTAILAAFLNGEIDDITTSDAAALGQLESAGYEPFDLPVSREVQFFAIPISTDADDPLSNQTVREAIYRYGIDWDDLALTAGGPECYHTDAIGKPAMPYYDESLEVNEYDPEKAKALLAEAGYGDGFATTIYAIPDTDAQATYMQDALKDLGITAEVETVDYTQVNGEYITGKAVSNGIVLFVMVYSDYTTNQDDRFNKFFSPIGALKGVTAFSDEQTELWEKVGTARSLEEQSAALCDFVKSYVSQDALLWPMNNVPGKTFYQSWYHVDPQAFCASAGRNPQYIWADEH